MLLVVSALVASLLAVPAGAVMDKADHTTSANACVGPATGDWMFTDVSDMHSFKDAINCIAYYGITKGSGDGSTFSPNDTVSRWEMALFMARAAGPAGMTLSMAADQGFADIGDAPAEAHDAINQLAAAGIMAGKSATMFDPNGTVSRADMAVILVNMLAQASSAVTIDKTGAIKLGAAGTGEADDYFPDARASQPRATDARIAAAYELGITTGTTMAPERAAGQTYAGLLTSFGPNSPVNRGEMAAFITRALNHTNARPEGVSAYRDSNGAIKASVRDAELNPVSGARLDLFYAATAKADEAFGQAGTCDPTVVSNKTGTLCRIDSADPVTNSSGNVTLAGPDATEHTVKTPQTIWVWTGDVGMIVVTATERFRHDLPEPKTPDLMATRTLVGDDSGGATLFRYGSDRTITLQLQNVDAGPPEVITDTSSGTTVGESAKWTYVVRLCSDDPTDADGTCTGLLSQSASMALTSDSNGQATISVSAPSDPTPGATDTDPNTDGQQPEERWVSVALTIGDGAPDATNTVNAAGTSTTAFEYKFSDQSNAATAGAGKVTHTSPYVVLATTSTARGSQLVTVTVNDQYGSPMAGQVVTLTAATATDISVVGGPYSTDGNGEAVIVYTITSTATQGWGEFAVTAQVGDPAVDVASGTVYFVEANSASETSTEIDYIDVASKTIVANNKVVVYDSGDQFTIGTTPSTMAEFEAKLAAESMRSAINDSIAWTNYPTDPTKRSTTTSTFTLTEA
ncbi:MAG: S-layer homology domain-containing protein [bacterium]|nr:S-layer homology domain-containing protein [bacterium]